MKKILSLILSIAIIFSLVAVPASAYRSFVPCCEYYDYCKDCLSTLVPCQEVLEIPCQPILESGAEIIEPNLIINDVFWLNTTSWTRIGSENNFFGITLRVQNRAGNPGNIRVEVRDGNNNLLGSNQNLAPGRLLEVRIPWNAGRYTVDARALNEGGHYNIITSRI